MELPFSFMVCCKLCTINTRTKIQVDNFLFLCFLFGVYNMKFITVVIVKEILFNCVIYAATP